MWSMLIVGAVVVGGVGLYNSLIELRDQRTWLARTSTLSSSVERT